MGDWSHSKVEKKIVVKEHLLGGAAAEVAVELPLQQFPGGDCEWPSSNCTCGHGHRPAETLCTWKLSLSRAAVALFKQSAWLQLQGARLLVRHILSTGLLLVQGKASSRVTEKKFTDSTFSSLILAKVNKNFWKSISLSPLFSSLSLLHSVPFSLPKKKNRHSTQGGESSRRSWELILLLKWGIEKFFKTLSFIYKIQDLWFICAPFLINLCHLQAFRKCMSAPPDPLKGIKRFPFSAFFCWAL